MGPGLLAFWIGGKQLPFLMGFYLQTDSPGPNSHEELQLSLLPGSQGVIKDTHVREWWMAMVASKEE